MATTPAVPTIRVQQLNVVMAEIRMPNGTVVPVYCTNEWRRPLEDMAKLVNDMQARLVAHGI